MQSILLCLKCFKGFGNNKTFSEKAIEDPASVSVDHQEIEINFKSSRDIIPLDTERNDSLIQGTINEFEIMSFGASSIKCASERCSSISDFFEIRASRGVSPNEFSIPLNILAKNNFPANDQTCLELHPPKSFAFTFRK